MWDNSSISELLIDASKRIGSVIEIVDDSGDVIISSDPKRIGVVDEYADNLGSEHGIIKNSVNDKTYCRIKNLPSGNCYLTIEGIGDNTADYIYLLSKSIAQIVKSSQQGQTKSDIFKKLIYGTIDKTELQEAAVSYKINMDSKVCILLIQADDKKANTIHGIMSKIFRPAGGDNLVQLSEYTVAVIKSVDNDNDMETIIELAEAIDETLETEVQCVAYIGIGGVKNSLFNLRDSYLEAQDAIDLGILQDTSGRIFVFQRLLLERFLQEIPKSLRKQFYDIAYTDILQNIMTEELLTTINAFYECNLNLSEAARKIYIHRNTLIYRLDKIKKATGFDLRNFDDAALLKIMLMLGNSLSK